MRQYSPSVGVSAGDRVEFVEVGPRRYEVVAVSHPVTELRRMFGKANKVDSIAEMNPTTAVQGTQASQ